jgi:hypothetical protein
LGESYCDSPRELRNGGLTGYTHSTTEMGEPHALFRF